MPHEDKTHIVAFLDCVSNVIDSITGDTEDVADAVRGKNVEDKVSDAHGSTPLIEATAPAARWG